MPTASQKPKGYGVDVHHHGADLAAGAVLIAIEAGAKDTDPTPGATAEARTASHRKVRQRATRLGLILTAVVVRGTVGEAGVVLGGGRGVGCWERAALLGQDVPGAGASAHHAIDEVEGHHPVQGTVEHRQQLGHHRLEEWMGQVGIPGRCIREGHREAEEKPCESASWQLQTPPRSR
jgi:hypothetical protein